MWICVLYAPWAVKPYAVVNTATGYLNCNNGKQYNIDNLNMSISLYDKKLHLNKDIERAAKICSAIDWSQYLENKEDKELMIAKGLHEYGDFYSLSLSSKSEVDWFTMIFCFIGLIGTYCFCNLIKQTLFYIVYGKKFTFGLRKAHD